MLGKVKNFRYGLPLSFLNKGKKRSIRGLSIFHFFDPCGRCGNFNGVTFHIFFFVKALFFT